jgi:hypothetical protein
VIDAVVADQRSLIADGDVAVVDGAAVRVQAEKILERIINEPKP